MDIGSTHPVTGGKDGGDGGGGQDGGNKGGGKLGGRYGGGVEGGGLFNIQELSSTVANSI